MINIMQLQCQGSVPQHCRPPGMIDHQTGAPPEASSAPALLLI